MTANGKARAQQWVAWFGGMALSAVTAAVTISFLFGGALSELERTAEKVAEHERRLTSITEAVARNALSSAETFQTKSAAREQELRLERWLARVETKLDQVIQAKAGGQNQ